MRIFILFICFYASATCLTAQDTLTLMSYNIRNARGMDEKINYERIIQTIRNEHADIIALQEIDSMTQRSGYTNLLRLLADSLHMTPIFAPAISFDGGKYGIGLLTHLRPIHTERIPLPGTEEARVLLLAEFPQFVCCCAHLSLTESSRMETLPILHAIANRYEKPLFLMGDFNTEPHTAFIKELQKEYLIISDAHQATYPANKPKETIDYILITRNEQESLSNISSRVVKETMASDHRPIIVSFTLQKE